MIRRRTIIIVSLILALFIMSNGYGMWQKKITIRGSIRVVKPKPEPEPEENFEKNKDGQENSKQDKETSKGEKERKDNGEGKDGGSEEG